MQKSLYGAHAGPEWDKCPDSAHMGPIYTCLLGSWHVYIQTKLICNQQNIERSQVELKKEKKLIEKRKKKHIDKKISSIGI